MSILSAVSSAIVLAEDELWRVQLELYPDSSQVSVDTVIQTWHLNPEGDEKIRDKMIDLQIEMLLDTNPDEKPWIARYYAACSTQECLQKQNQRLHSIALALANPVKVFYECGLKDDGSYTHRGCRYGTEPHEYHSGFEF